MNHHFLSLPALGTCQLPNLNCPITLFLGYPQILPITLITPIENSPLPHKLPRPKLALFIRMILPYDIHKTFA